MALLMYQVPWFQLVFFALQAIVVIAYLGFIKPYKIEADNISEFVNEIMLVLYGLRSLSLLDISADFDQRVNYGNFSICFVLLLIVINIIRWVYGIYSMISLRFQKKDKSKVETFEKIELVEQKQA